MANNTNPVKKTKKKKKKNKNKRIKMPASLELLMPKCDNLMHGTETKTKKII